MSMALGNTKGFLTGWLILWATNFNKVQGVDKPMEERI
jgi:hypothetical protein